MDDKTEALAPLRLPSHSINDSRAETTHEGTTQGNEEKSGAAEVGEAPSSPRKFGVKKSLSASDVVVTSRRWSAGLGNSTSSTSAAAVNFSNSAQVEHAGEMIKRFKQVRHLEIKDRCTKVLAVAAAFARFGGASIALGVICLGIRTAPAIAKSSGSCAALGAGMGFVGMGFFFVATAFFVASSVPANEVVWFNPGSLKSGPNDSVERKSYAPAAVALVLFSILLSVGLGITGSPPITCFAGIPSIVYLFLLNEKAAAFATRHAGVFFPMKVLQQEIQAPTKTTAPLAPIVDQENEEDEAEGYTREEQVATLQFSTSLFVTLIFLSITNSAICALSASGTTRAETVLTEKKLAPLWWAASAIFFVDASLSAKAVYSHILHSDTVTATVKVSSDIGTRFLLVYGLTLAGVACTLVASAVTCSHQKSASLDQGSCCIAGPTYYLVAGSSVTLIAVTRLFIGPSRFFRAAKAFERTLNRVVTDAHQDLHGDEEVAEGLDPETPNSTSLSRHPSEAAIPAPQLMRHPSSENVMSKRSHKDGAFVAELIDSFPITTGLVW